MTKFRVARPALSEEKEEETKGDYRFNVGQRGYCGGNVRIITICRAKRHPTRRIPKSARKSKIPGLDDPRWTTRERKLRSLVLGFTWGFLAPYWGHWAHLTRYSMLRRENSGFEWDSVIDKSANNIKDLTRTVGIDHPISLQRNVPVPVEHRRLSTRRGLWITEYGLHNLLELQIRGIH